MDNRKKTKVVDFIHNDIEYGRDIFDDNVVIPWMRYLGETTKQYKAAWDRIENKWRKISADSVLVETTVFDRFVDDPTAKHGYRAVRKRIMVEAVI